MGKTLAVIAGQGQLPITIGREAKKVGYRVLFIALQPLQDEVPEDFDMVERINVARFGKILKTLKKAGVEDIVMAGKVPKTLMYENTLIPDTKALKLLKTLKDRKDDTIMKVVTEVLEKEGFRVRNTTDFTEGLMIKSGTLTRTKPSRDEKKDIAFGFRIAKEIGRLDIGQTVVVKSRAVMAVEAIEGTDEAILRGGSLAGQGAVVVKVSKPQQDMRFDVPTVGLKTLESMLKVRARVLAVEADRTIAVDIDKMVEFADKNGLCITAVNEKTLSPR